MKITASKLWTLAALLMYVAAVFCLVDGNWLIGALFFVAATFDMAAAAKYRKREKAEEEKKENDACPSGK